MLAGLQNQISFDVFSNFCRNYHRKPNELAQHLDGSKLPKVFRFYR
jgi:hypothetical protein